LDRFILFHVFIYVYKTAKIRSSHELNSCYSKNIWLGLVISFNCSFGWRSKL